MQDPTFMEACLNGTAHVEEVDDWVEVWHNADSTDLSLQEFLGLTDEEYNSWARDPATLIEIVESKMS